MCLDDDWEDIDSSESGSSDEVVGVMDVEDSEGNNNYVRVVDTSTVYNTSNPTHLMTSLIFGVTPLFRASPVLHHFLFVLHFLSHLIYFFIVNNCIFIHQH